MMRCPDPGRTADPVRPVKWTLRADAFGPVALGLLLWVVTPSAPVADSAMKGDVAGVRALLARGADVNAAQGDGMTALHWAAMNGGFEIAQVVIDAGADTEATTRLGRYTPLHLASRAGQATTVKTLLKAGARVDARSSTGDVTPLHFAAAAGDADAIGALIGGRIKRCVKREATYLSAEI